MLQHIVSTFGQSHDILHNFRPVRRFRDIFKYISPVLIFPNDVPSHQQIPHFRYFEHMFAILSIYIASLWHIMIFMTCPAFMLIFSHLLTYNSPPNDNPLHHKSLIIDILYIILCYASVHSNPTFMLRCLFQCMQFSLSEHISRLLNTFSRFLNNLMAYYDIYDMSVDFVHMFHTFWQ